MSPRNDRVGQTHGVFEVVALFGVKNGVTLWSCICTRCGSTTVRQNRYFRKDRPVPVGCVGCKGENHHKYKGYKGLSGVYLARIENQAKERGYEYSVKPEYLWSLFEEQSKSCYLTNLPISFSDNSASLDRIDNSRGYVCGNVAWCHKEINKMKGTLTLAEFVYYANKVVREPNVKEIK
jgi:hypothetical protein